MICVSVYSDSIIAIEEENEIESLKLNPRSSLRCRRWSGTPRMWFRGELSVYTPSGSTQAKLVFDVLLIKSEKWVNNIEIADEIKNIVKVI